MTLRVWPRIACLLLAAATLASLGCHYAPPRLTPTPAIENMPRELVKTTLPEHVIEPPDILQIDLVTAVPKPPYKLQPLDALSIRASGTLPDAPIGGIFQIDTDGTVNLGSAYGLPVTVVGLTVPEARTAIQEALNKILKGAIVEVALAQSRGQQQVRGPHLVRPDGTVWFDIYGAVRVVGMTLPQAKLAVEEHLAQFFLKPEVAISITGYNSKVYYVCFDSTFGGAGPVYRLPVTGNETVLDVVSQVGGMAPYADYKRIWIARPAPMGGCPQILPVDWKAITEKAEVATNYQILPGDRLYVKSAPSVVAAARIDRLLRPMERLMGFYLLGQGIINQGVQNRIGQNFLQGQ